MADLFRTTRWSLIVAAGGSDAEATDALAELYRAYWRPVYAYVRRHGHAAEEADDLTQAFFLHLLEHRGFERANPARGRFRAYLLTAARNFLSNARAHELTARRGAGTRHESIEAIDAERHLALNAADLESSPEAVFERQWALRVAERALERLKCDYAARGQEDVFQQVRPLLTSDTPSPDQTNLDADTPTYPRTTAHAGACSDAFRAALHRARRRFGEALRREIQDTVADEHVDDELRHLVHVLTL